MRLSSKFYHLQISFPDAVPMPVSAVLFSLKCSSGHLHSDIFLDRIILFCWYVHFAVCVEYQTSCYISSISFIRLYPTGIRYCHCRWCKNNAFHSMLCKLMVKRIPKASGFVPTDEFYFISLQVNPRIYNCEVTSYYLIGIRDHNYFLCSF